MHGGQKVEVRLDLEHPDGTWACSFASYCHTICKDRKKCSLEYTLGVNCPKYAAYCKTAEKNLVKEKENKQWTKFDNATSAIDQMRKALEEIANNAWTWNYNMGDNTYSFTPIDCSGATAEYWRVPFEDPDQSDPIISYS